MAEKEVRPVRGCDSCGGVDDHPRHVFAHAPGDGATSAEVAVKMLDNAPPESREAIMAQVRDDSTIMKHMDCCRADGCPDGSCNVVTAGAESKRGDDLLKHLVKQKPITSDEDPGAPEEPAAAPQEG